MPAPPQQPSSGGPDVDAESSETNEETETVGAPVVRISGRPRSLTAGQRLVTITGGDRWMAAEAFVYDQYRNLGYCGESSRGQVEELARWSGNSRFHAVVDGSENVVGTLRTIFGSFAQLPVGQFERTDHADPDPVCELSSLVVSPDHRSTGVIEHLYRAGWLDAYRSGSNAVVALIDPWLLEAFVDTYHLPFRTIGTSEHYMGTDPVPVSMPLVGSAYIQVARANPEFWRWTLEALDAHEAGAWGLPIVISDTPTDAVNPSPREARADRSRG